MLRISVGEMSSVSSVSSVGRLEVRWLRGNCWLLGLELKRALYSLCSFSWRRRAFRARYEALGCGVVGVGGW